ncbi:MAG TPA: septum formation initiator family protein [Candidatus Amulumruptor caecigallinarius]|uniref:Septum formation initiator family protein n=1 Tax=Candidatus Amulumruptor caecigallinarius TaxID=2109911 RepID=A0A921E8C0_9BACT|nr:septum formation initiator family protein [Candidatus Amulumruptor caecigallinarius]
MAERSSFIAWCKRYISVSALVIAGALVYVLFFNDNSILNHYQYEGEIDRLKAEIKVNRDSLEYYRAMNSRLDTDREAMEQIVREQYHMQRPNEDVYIVE